MFTLLYKRDFVSTAVRSIATSKILCVALAAMLAATLPAWADVYGRISGVVTDPAGATVPGATLTLTNVDTGTTTQTTSLAQGTYAFPAVPVGHYNLEIKRTGFATSREEGIVIDVNTVRIIDFHLKVTSDVQQVTVTAEAAAVVDTASTQMGAVITEQQILDAPLNGRDFTALMSLQPGVVPQNSGEGSGSGGLSVNGARESGDGFLLNGASIENGQFNSNLVTPNLDSIQEFRMITNTFDAEYGQFYGAIVNVATKAGTDKYHGSAFDFLRNTDFNARQYFSGAVENLIQNQYGFTVGGPIVPKRLFFFADYQGTRTISDSSTGPVFVPTNEMRGGNFLPWVQDAESQAGGANPITGTVVGSYWANELSQKLGYAVTVGEPYYKDGCTAGNRTCVFPDAQVPQSAISPIATNLLKHVPQIPQGSVFGVNFFIDNTPKSKSGDDIGAIRLDYHHRIGDLTFYFSQDEYSSSSGIGAGETFAGFPTVGLGYATVWNLGLTTAVSATKLNELRVAAAHNGSQVVPGGTGGTTTSETGFVTGANTAGVVITDPALDGVPYFGTNEFATGVSLFDFGNWYYNYQLSDNFSIQAGRHAIKFGGAIYDNHVINKPVEFANGDFGFNGAETGSDIMDLTIGALDGFAQGVEFPYHMRAYNFGIFAQDSLRVRPDLTINYGLRWDVPKPWAEENGEITNLNPGQQSVVFPNAPKGYVFPGDPGISKSQAPNRYRTFAPRVGIAFSPAGSSDTLLGRLVGKAGTMSIHTGFGVFYTSLEEEMANIDIGAAPFGEFYANSYRPELATPFVDRTTGIQHLQAFPVKNVYPPSRSHPNPLSFAAFEPISASPGYWHDNTVPYSYQYNLTVQRQMTPKDLFQIGYVGSQGHKLPVNTEANPGNQALCLSLSTQADVASGSPTCGPGSENEVYTAANGTVSQGTRGPFGIDFASDGIIRTEGASWYNSLETSWKHEEKSLTFTLGYTYSRAIDSGSGWSEMLNPVNPSVNHALSSYDIPNNFVADYRWELPFARIHRDRFTEGWVVSGITHIAQGLPVSMYETDDQSLLGDTGSGGGSGADTPVYARGNLHLGIPHHDIGQPFTYFNTSLFSQEPLGKIGTSKVRFFHGPSTDNTDLAFMKVTQIRESVSLQVRFELFNAFNHTQYGGPNSTWTGGSTTPTLFGVINGAAAPRIGQAALKILF